MEHNATSLSCTIRWLGMSEHQRIAMGAGSWWVCSSLVSRQDALESSILVVTLVVPCSRGLIRGQKGALAEAHGAVPNSSTTSCQVFL